MGSESERTTVKAEFAIGIDLGTTYSCVGIWRSDRVEIIGQDQTKHMPSCVAFYEESDEDEDKHTPKRLIGEAAVNEDDCSTTNIIYDSKRLIGRRFSEETVQSDMKMWPFKVIQGDDDKPMISVTCENLGVTKKFSPEEISAMVLRKLKETVEEFLSTEKIKVKVEDAVITVPAYFDQSQRQATIEAGKIAGLNVLRLLNEPTAAAVAYTLNILEENKNNLAAVEKKKNVLVFDLGGGTFDVSCLTVTNNKIEVKAVGGDSHLGGQDFVNRMVDHIVKVFKKKHNKDISEGTALRKLRKECEKTKRSLSTNTYATIYIESLHEKSDKKGITREKITRAEFEEVNLDLFKRCMEGVEKCLIEAKMDKKDVDEVVLIGGSSKIPKIQQMLRELMNGKELYKSIDPFEAVAIGAAVQAALLSGRGSGKIKDLMLVDVTPLSLGVQVVGEVMSVIIPKNTSIPTRAERNYTTIRDNQTTIKFLVYEGERAKSKDNKLLGELTLSGIKPALRTATSVAVSFNLQCDGILEVTAKDRGTGQEISTSIKGMKLSGEDIQRMIKEANEYEESDAMFRKKGEARHSFHNYICKLRNEIKSENMKAEGKKKVEKAVEEAFEWLDSQGGRLAEVSEYEERKKRLRSMIRRNRS